MSLRTGDGTVVIFSLGHNGLQESRNRFNSSDRPVCTPQTTSADERGGCDVIRIDRSRLPSQIKTGADPY